MVLTIYLKANITYFNLIMPFIDDGKETTYKNKITKEEEKTLRKKGYKPYDVRVSLHFPRGGKFKVWAKNKDDASTFGIDVVGAQTLSPSRAGGSSSVRAWKKPKHPKTRTKRKNNPRYVPKKVKRTHPKTGKKFTQTIYIHSKDWWKHPR